MKRAGHSDDERGAVEGKILRYLEAHHVMTIATTQPWAAAVFYVNEGYTLYFLSSPRTRHSTALAADSRVAVTVQEDYTDWREIKGVQLEGTVRRVQGSAETRVRAIYAAKFPLIGASGSAAGPIVQALARIHWYRVDPTGVYFVDNSVGFGHRDFIDLRGA
jgi:uncharacterized protein YhbP (UPF0306 family)